MAGRRASTTSATVRNAIQLDAGAPHQAPVQGYSAQLGYTLQKAVQQGGDYFFWDPDVEEGPADWDRTHIFTAAVAALLPIGKGQRFMSDASTSPMRSSAGGSSTRI